MPTLPRSSVVLQKTHGSKTFPLGEKLLPAPLPFKKLVGPSLILLGLGLGSGEVILWPYLVSNYGMGVIWGMIIGITMQFFLNMEIERYALVRGESIFVGFARMSKWLPAWFILSTFIGFGWPGIGHAGSTLLSHAFGQSVSPTLISMLLFTTIGVILSVGRVVYTTVEQLLKYLIGFSVPFLVILTLWFARPEHYVALAQGMIGIGDGYLFLPAGIAMGVFLGALAYSGAGGNLNLSQSFYVRDKGYGMGIHADRIQSMITNKGGSTAISLTGNRFPLTKQQLGRFRAWWKVVNIEHAVVFWGLGLFTMMLLALLAFTTTYGLESNVEGISFVLNEASVIGRTTLPIIGSLFLVGTGLMLSGTQLTILDSTSRIITENILLAKKKARSKASKTYYIVLWLQIAFGMLVLSLGFDQPKELIILGAVINAFAMFVFSGLILLLNNRYLELPLRPSAFRNIAVFLSFLILGGFSFYNLAQSVF